MTESAGCLCILVSKYRTYADNRQQEEESNQVIARPMLTKGTEQLKSLLCLYIIQMMLCQPQRLAGVRALQKS